MECILKVSRLMESAFLLGIIVIIFRGQTVLSGISNLMFLVIMISAVGGICIKNKICNIKTKCLWMFAFLMWGCLSYFWSADKARSFNLIILFAPACFVLFYNYNEYIWTNFFKWGTLISNIVAISIFLEVLSPNIFIKLFGFFLLRPEAALASALGGEYTGIAGGNQHPAVILLIGISICLGKCYSSGRIDMKSICILLSHFIAIFLTGKRSLTLIALALFLFYYLASNSKNKYSKFIIALIVVSIVAYILMVLNPAIFGGLKQYFSGEDESDLLSGRGNFWLICGAMFIEKPYFGYGLGSFNAVFFDKTHYLFEGAPWSYDAHNIYFQMAAELGTVGLVFFAFQIIVNIRNIIYLFKNKHQCNNVYKQVLFFSTCVIAFCLIYGLSGNLIYTTNELIVYLVAIAGLNDTIIKNGGQV